MEIDAEKFRRIIVTMFENLRMMEIETLTLKMLFVGSQGWTEETFPQHAPEFEQAMAFGRNNAYVKAVIDQKFEPVLKLFNEAMDAKAVEEIASEFMKHWKPNTKPN